MPVFSVCVLVANGGRPLTGTLQSCAGHFDEIVAAVPAENAGLRAAARAYAQRMVFFDPRAGAPAALQSAFEAAGGAYLFWLKEGETFSATETAKLRALRRALRTETVQGVRLRCLRTAGTETPAWYRHELRAVHRRAPYRWEDEANPILLLESSETVFDITVTQMPAAAETYAAGLAYYRQELARAGTLAPRAQLYYARALRDGGEEKAALEAYGRLMQNEQAEEVLRAAACVELAACQTNAQARLGTLLAGLRFTAPQADICCGIGSWLLENRRYTAAADWFERALAQKQPVSARPVYPDNYGYVPALQLCRCWYALGDTAKAEQYNRLAGDCKPNDASVLANERFFAGLRRGQTGSTDIPN